MSITVHIEDRLLQQLRRLHPQQADDLIAEIAFDGERYVKQSFGSGRSLPGNPPGVDTGKLRAGIYVYRARFLHRVISTGDTEYAPHLEFGTRKMAARPFMTPMARWLEREMEQKFRSYIRRML